MATKKKLIKKTHPIKKAAAKRQAPLRNKNLPVTQGQFSEFRSEVNYKFTSMQMEFKAVRSEMGAMEKRIDARFNEVDARFARIDARFNEIDARFDKIDARFNEIDGRFSKIEAQIADLISVIHQMRMTIEEQNARNKYVLDGFANLIHLIDSNKKETDERIDNLEQLIKASKDSEL